MTRAVDVMLGLVLFGVALFVVVQAARDILRHRRALRVRRLEDIGIPVSANEDELTQQDRIDRLTAKRAGLWPWKVLA